LRSDAREAARLESRSGRIRREGPEAFSGDQLPHERQGSRRAIGVGFHQIDLVAEDNQYLSLTM
jgi:hypothetical protein